MSGPKWFSLKKSTILCCGMFFLFALVWTHESFQVFTWTFDKFFYDSFSKFSLKNKSEPKHSQSILLDAISLHQLGYPINRSYYASLVNEINKEDYNQPVVIDVIFGDSNQIESTEALAKTFINSKRPIIVSSTISEQWQPPIEIWNDKLKKNLSDSGLSLDGPYPPILEAAKQVAVSDIYADDDGILRWYPLVHAIGGQWFPSLALASWELVTGLKWEVITDEKGVSDLWLGKIKINLKDDPFRLGRILINSRSLSHEWPSFSLVDFNSEKLVGKTVFVGTNVDGLKNYLPTAVDFKQVPIHIHQFVFEDLIESNYIKKNSSLELILILISCLSLFLAGQRSLFNKMSLLVLLPLVTIPLVTSIAYYFFSQYQFVSPAPAVILSILSGFYGFISRLNRTEKDREFIRISFSHYLHPEIVNKMLIHQELPNLTGERKEITIMFIDLRNFTSLSEKLEAKQLVDFMNHFFQLVTSSVQDNEGTIDKYIGDAVMAFWNAPIKIKNKEDKAIEGIFNILKDFQLFQETIKKEHNVIEVPNIGIGLHTGEAIVGNVGGGTRFNYTALGDNVNIASRLEGLCKNYHVPILMSEEFVSKLSTVPENLIKLDKVYLKGKDKPLQIYTILKDKSLYNEREWLRFMDAYSNGEWKLAAQLLNENINWPWREEFESRILIAQTKPVTNWFGVWRMNSK